MRGSFFVGLLLMGAAVTAAAASLFLPPAAQVDVFTHRPTAQIDLTAQPVRAAVAEAVERLGQRRALSLAGGGRGAPGVPERLVARVMKAVSVRRVGADRIRIRVASRDLAAAHALAEAVRVGIVNGGVRERLRITSESRGGRTMMAATLLTVLALIYAAAAALRAAVSFVYRPTGGVTGAPRPLRGAASTR